MEGRQDEAARDPDATQIVVPGEAVSARPTVGRYEILEELGRGGMGVVYRARHVHLGRESALKVLLDSFDSPAALERFRREGKIVASLEHPNLVRVYDWDEDGGRAYLAMELVDGESLEKRLARGRLPRREALALVETVARALHHAHEMGVVHRDLKPGNILISKTGSVKVTDFGLARTTEPGDPMLTRAGEILGTPAYVAPEQCSGTAVDRRADVHALGLVLYEVLTGRRPYAGPTPFDLMTAICREEPAPPSSVDPSIARELDRISLRALEKDPRRRHATALEFAEDLARASGDTPRAKGQRPRAIALAAVGVAAIAAAVVGVVALVARDAPEARETPVSTAGEWLDLAKAIDPTPHVIRGRFSRDAESIVSSGASEDLEILELPYEPPLEYDFRIEFVCLEGRGSIDQYFSRDDSWAVWSMWCANYETFGILREWALFQSIQENPEAFPWQEHSEYFRATDRGIEREIAIGRAYVSTIEVRAGEIRVLLDDRPVSTLRIGRDGWRTDWPHSLGNPRRLGIGAYRSRVRFDRIEVRSR